MKISYNWLTDYVDHGLTPDQLADLLTMSGLEVEEVVPVGSDLEGVVVGRVLETTRHPNADRLTLCQVDLGAGAPVQIVCGAPNVAAGQKVPVATVGATLMLPDRNDPAKKVPVTLRKAKLRGEVSEGMICAEDELGLSDDHAGIMVLDADAAPGHAFTDYLRTRGLAAQDAVLDVSITPNRPDAVSHLGTARDVAALTRKPLARPGVDLPEGGGEAAGAVRIDIEAPEACRRYVGLLVRGVTIAESPAWLKQRLTAVGLRPRNNVVDVTNYVMYECGQPLHAFDFDQIAGRRIVVRLTETEETFTTLDDKARTLPAGTLLICDEERPVAIAGIMGGENSEVSGGTTNVLIESAYFDPTRIRRTAKALGLQTDASYRFERGVDAEGQAWAAARAAQLIAEIAGGEIVPGMVDAHPSPLARRSVRLRPARVHRLLGIEVPHEEIQRLLEAIGFTLTEDTEGEEVAFHCTVPPFRPDVEREVDLIEEVARLYGYDRIPEPPRTSIPNATPRALPNDVLRRRARALLAGLGYREIYTNSMQRRETAERFNRPELAGGDAQGEVVETLNPISQEMAALRPSLLPGLLQVMQFNQNHGQRTLRFFELGHVFRRTSGEGTVVPGYLEHEALLVALSGPQRPAGWDGPERIADFFDLKGLVERLLGDLQVPAVRMTPVYEPTPVAAHHLQLHAGDVLLGTAARLTDDLARAYDLKAPLFFAELDWAALVNLAAPALQQRYAPVSRFPVVERDLAVVVESARLVGPLVETIREAAGELLQDVGVFDLYEGERIDAGRKSVAFALRFGADRTLQDAEVDARIEDVVSALSQTHGAELRR